jgi:hypothetical protein
MLGHSKVMTHQILTILTLIMLLIETTVKN